MKLNLSQLNALRPILAVPVWQCVAGLSAVVVLLIGGFVFYFWMPMQDSIVATEKAIESQQRIYQRNIRTAKDLPRKKRQFEALKKELKLASAMLPEKSQIPDLLEGVSRAGRHAGLQFENFKPLHEIKRELHAEVPVALSMTGSFRQVVLFLRTVGEMPRIVDIKNLSFAKGKKGQALSIKGKAVTFRLLDDNELKNNKRKNNKARAGR